MLLQPGELQQVSYGMLLKLMPCSSCLSELLNSPCQPDCIYASLICNNRNLLHIPIAPIVPIILPFRIVWLLKVIDHQYASILSCIGSQPSCMLLSFAVLGRCLLERGANALGSKILSSILHT